MNTQRFEIILNKSAITGTFSTDLVYLDTYQTEGISLNYNIADLTDINIRNSSFSKTIRIPETKNNRLIFDNISQLNASSQFNPNLKTRAWIMVDGLMVFEGYLQLRYVYVNDMTGKREYEVVIYADNDNFFKAMGETYLTDMDWQEANHVWDANTIMASWTASNDSLPYYYPLIDYGYDWDYLQLTPNQPAPPATASPDAPLYYNSVLPTQMFPATNVKYMVDKIFADAGYTYQSTFFNSPFFKKLYIPFNRKTITSTVNEADWLFSVGRLTSSSFSTYFTNPAGGGIGNPGISNYVVAYPATNQPASYYYNPVPFNWGTYRLPFNDETAPNGDPNNLFDTTNSEFVAPATGAIPGMQFYCDFEIEFEFGIDPDFITTNNTSLHGPAGSPVNWIAFRRDRDPFGNPSLITRFLPVNGYYGRIPFNSQNVSNLQLLDPIQVTVYDETNNPDPPFTTKTRYKTIRGTIASDALTGGLYNYPVQYNEKIWVEIKCGIVNGEYREQVNQQFGAGVGWGGAGNGYFVGTPIALNNIFQGTQRPNVAPGTLVGNFTSNIRFYNTIVEELQLGQTINYNNIIPKNIKNKDFIASLLKMFNLFIEPSKELDKVLLVETRDTYYEGGEIKDWTYKVDNMTPIQEQILGDTQNREIRLKYKDDNDFFNEDYRKKENISFGEFRKDLDNEFVTGIKTIEPIFSPTPLVLMKNSVDIIIPKIGKLNNNLFEGTDFNVRILTRYEPNQDGPWRFGGLTASPSTLYPNFACITSTGIAPQRTHALNVGDVIDIQQFDGGVQYPTLEGSFEVVEVINNRTIVIRVAAPPFTGYQGGNAYPLPGVVGSQPWQFRLNFLVFPIVPVVHNFYPYLGHFSHPRRPNYDLNFGQCIGYYHPLETVTGDNLHRLFYQNMLEELTDKDSRIVTMSMILDAEDIWRFKFSDNIYINGLYYKVNKITDYDPTVRGTCKVELIKTKAPLRIPLPTLNFGGVFGRYETPGPQRQMIQAPFPDNVGVLSTNGTNQISRNDTLVAGRENITTAQRSIVAGNRNEVYSDLNLVVGDSNFVDTQSNNNFVLGSRNQIQNGVDNSVVIGNDLLLSSSNTFGFSGTLVSLPNNVSASRNEILSPFNIKPPNYISGSRNSVFEWGSQDPVNYISGHFYVKDS